MAIIRCPGCRNRISDQNKHCPHCELPLGEMTDEDVAHFNRKRWRKRVYYAANLTYVAMTLCIGGAAWWWMATPDAWGYPAPTGAVLLVALGVVVYVVSRGWLFWLRMRRNRPS